jgi:hypothetical protein
VVADCQHQRVDDITVGAEQTHLPVRKAFEQPPEGPFVTVTALPVNQPPGLRPSRSRPCCPCAAGSATSHRTRSPPRRWVAACAAVPIDIAADPAQHRLRRGAEQVGDGAERQTIAVQADGRASGRFGRAVPLRASKLVAAPFATPPLLACDEAEPDAAATAAPGTVRKRGDHQDAKQ